MASSSQKSVTKSPEKKTSSSGNNGPDAKRRKVVLKTKNDERSTNRRGRKQANFPQTRADVKRQGVRKGATATTITTKKSGKARLRGGQKRLQKEPIRKRPYRAAATGRPLRSNLQDRAEDPSPVALLDMLAEVASATLEGGPAMQTQLKRGPGRNTRSSVAQKHAVVAAEASKVTTVVSKRSAQPELLGLDQIRMLSDKLLLNMFAELTADEIRRNYSYACYLVPDKCQQRYTSFGNETRARVQMKTHLLGHIAELLAESNSRSTQRTKFMAEPVMVRKRRLALEIESSRKKRGLRKPQGRVAVLTESKPVGAPVVSKVKIPHQPAKDREPVKAEASSDTEGPDKKQRQQSEADGQKKVVDKARAGEVRWSLKGAVKPVATSREVGVRGVVSPKAKPGLLPRQKDPLPPVELDASECYEQPQHDHCYTTVNGGKNLPDHYDRYEDDECSGEEDEEEEYDDEEEEEKEEVDCGVDKSSDGSGNPTGGPDLSKGLYVVAEIEGYGLPAATTSSTPTVFRSKQAEMALKQLEAIRILQMQKGKKTAQQQQQQLLELAMEGGGAVAVDYFMDNDADEPMDSDSEKNALDKGSPEWERKLALKCIRMLRTKKKDEHVPLVCRICKGKSFTAQATLMYHYRSHAGIKPFVCSICNTTFTRQHSLNYHMLIHNNKSRFTCADCGRKFRHPSHFKEHMRRHTGETPFECADCGVRFKTRNTYKRHLKTRHGKLLTASGIMTLSTEEFLKVKTNPKKKPRSKKDKDTQWPETTPLLQQPGVSLKAIAISNVPLMPDIDSGETFLMQQNVATMATFVSVEPKEGEEQNNEEVPIQSLCTTTAPEFDDDDDDTATAMHEDDDNDDCPNPFESIILGKEPLDARHSIIVLEALPSGSGLAAITGVANDEGDGKTAEEWSTQDAFSAEAAIAAIALQPILQCT